MRSSSLSGADSQLKARDKRISEGSTSDLHPDEDGAHRANISNDSIVSGAVLRAKVGILADEVVSVRRATQQSA